MSDEWTVDFKGKNVVLVGRMKTMSSTIMRQHISRLGGINRNTPRGTTHIFVVGDGGGKKADRAKINYANRATFLTEAEFSKALDALEAPTHEPVALGDALAELRSAFDGTPTRASWLTVRSLIDACDAEQREEAVRYVASHTSRWPNPWDRDEAPQDVSTTDSYFMSSLESSNEGELCFPSNDWWLRMIEGERAAEFGLVTAIMFGYKRVNGTIASKIVTHPDLVNLRSLDLGMSHKLSKTFFKTLRTSEVMGNLEALHLRALDTARASALCGAHALTSLRHVLVGRTEVDTGMAGSPWAALFEAGWWGQIEGLCVDNLDAFARRRGSSTHDSFARELLRHIDALERLGHVRLFAPGAMDLLRSDELLDRIERLSLNARTERNLSAVAERLARPNVLKVLDLSGAWPGYRRGRSEEAPVAIFEHLCDAKLLRGLTELRLFASGLSGSQRVAFKHACEDAGVALTWVKVARA